MQKINENISYYHGGPEKLSLVEPLWTKLNKYHEENSAYFKERFSKFTFQSRKNKILENNNYSVTVILAENKNNGEIIGYCIAKIDEENVGEIESIYVEDDYRENKVGDALMKQALKWFKENKVIRKHISVAYGNNKALDFYRKYGFYPHIIVLEEKA